MIVLSMKLTGNCPREMTKVRCEEQGRKGNLLKEGRKWKESEEELWGRQNRWNSLLPEEMSEGQ